MYKKIIIISTLLSALLNADDRFYDLGKKFLSGEEGSISEKKIISNCPYEACKLNEDKVREINVDTPNVRSGISLLEQSVENTSNIKSASLIISHLLDQINYKDKEQSKYLIIKIKKDYGLSELEFKNKIKKYVDFLYNKKSCEGYYYIGQLSAYGYVYKKDTRIAMKNLEIAKKECYVSKNLLFYTNSSASLQNLTNIDKADW